MQIILMRHGQPELDLDAIKLKRMSPSSVGKIVNDYEATNLEQNSFPPQDSLNLARDCDRAICSNLPRAIDSIRKLEIESKCSVEHEFRESSLPYLTWRYPHLSFYSWCLIFRVLWFFGFARNGEPIHMAKKRAKHCVTKLCKSDKVDDTVLLLGHGIMNRLIARELKKQGWTKAYSSSSQYWSHITFEK